MKSIAEKVFSQLPSYIPDLVAMIGRPKRTIAAKTGGEEDDLAKAIVFVGITVGLGFLLQAPTLPAKADFITAAAAMAAFKAIAILLFAGVFWGAFRLLGGKGAYLQTLIAYIYMVCPLYLALSVMDLVAIGFVRAYDPELGLQVRANPLFLISHPEILARFQSEAPALSTAMAITNNSAVIVLMLWFVICLGAFRSLHGVSRLRSCIAGTLIILLWWPFTLLILFLLVGIFGSMGPPLR